MPKIQAKRVRVKDPETGIWHDLPAVVSEESFLAAQRASASEAAAAQSAAAAEAAAEYNSRLPVVEAMAAAERAEAAAVSAAESAENAIETAESAVETAESAERTAEHAAGTATAAAVAAVPEAVTDWLDDNVTPVGSAVTVDASLSIEGSAADAKKTGDGLIAFKRLLDTVNPSLSVEWTLGKSVSNSQSSWGTVIDNPYTALTNKIPCTPGDTFRTDSPTVDENNKFLVYYVCEYSGDTLLDRTEFTAQVRSIVIGDTTDNIRVIFGRYQSSGITITQEDIEEYVSIEFMQKAAAESLVRALSDKIDEIGGRVVFENKYAYSGNDANSINSNSVYFCAEGTANNPTADGGYYIETILYRPDGAAAMQLGWRFDNGLMFYRRKVTNVWRSWICISAHSAPSTPLYYAFGESLTWGAVWTPSDASPYYTITQASLANQIPTRIANAIGSSYNFANKGVGGSYFVGSGNNTILAAIQAVSLSNTKIVTVGGGRNDSENPLGDKNSTPGDGTICGAIREILEYLTGTYKKLQIVWIGVTPNTSENASVFTRVTEGGWSLNTFDEKVSELCAAYGVPYIDWKLCTHIRKWADYSGAGGVWSHPDNEESYLQMGNYLAGRVASYYKG